MKLICYMTCSKTCSKKRYERCWKSYANQALFVVGERRVAGTARQRHASAAGSLLWQDSGAEGAAE